MFKDRIEHIGKDGEPLKVRSELEIGRRLAFVLELIARGEVKAKLPKDAPLLDGLDCRFILSDLVADKLYAAKAAEGDFNFMRTNAAYKRSMEIAYKRWRW